MYKNALNPTYQELALFLLRLILGSIFIAHGAQKVLGIFGGKGIEQFVQFGASMNVPAIFMWAAAYAEFIGGLFMFFGIATELGALFEIPVMIGAIVLVHGDKGYFAQNGGFEYALNLMLLAIVVIIGGPGCCALWDPFIKYR